MILSLIFGIIIGSIAIYIALSPKVKQRKQLDEETERLNASLKAELQMLQNEYSNLNRQYDDVYGRYLKTSEDLAAASDRQASINKSINESVKELENNKVRAEELAQSYLETQMDNAKMKFQKEQEIISEQYEKFKEEAKDEYLKVLEDSSNYYTESFSEKQEKLSFLISQIEDLQAKVDAAIAQSKRAAEAASNQDFYRLVLTTEDLEEIAKLKSVLPYLRDAEPLNKVIYKVYYEKPYTDMIGRVVGQGVHTGIYKITNIKNGMCYVGQRANIADRWKQHIKRGLGAETPTRNKLYPAMAAFGVENFTFEILEECDRRQLDSKEDYWQGFFHAMDYGYSIK